MKIALIAPSAVPFTVGGAEKLWWGLLHHTNQLSSHQMELIKLPSPERDFRDLLASYRRFSELDLSHFDRVISTKYPAWMVSHPEHHVYLQHTLRGLYDTYPWPERARHDPFEPVAWPGERAQRGIGWLRHYPPLAALRRLLAAPPERAQLSALFARVERLLDDPMLPPGVREGLFAFPGPLTRAIIHRLDAIALAPGAITRYAAISRNVTRRADYFPQGVPVKIIHHPSDLPALPPVYFKDQRGDYLFTVSRLDAPKRVDLLLRAFLRTEVEIELRIAGTGPMEDELKAMAADDPRVRFLGFVRDSEIVDHYRHALAVPFLPFDEDYGLITVEAMAAAKPIITCHDTGGVNEFVVHGETGWSVAPEEAALAAAIEDAVADPARARRMGRAARQAVAHVTWKDTVRELLDPPADGAATAEATPFPTVTGRGDGTQAPDDAETPTPPERSSETPPAEGPHWLVVNTYAVYPPMGGGQNRMFHLYRHVARELGTRVTLLVLAPGETHESRREIAPGLVEHRIPLSVEQARQQRQLTETLGVPVDDIAAIDGWRHNPRFIEALREHAATVTLGVAAHPYLVDALAEHLDVPWWYEAHNVETAIKRAILGDALVAERETTRRAAEEALRRVDAAEARACRESQRLLVCAEQDLNAFAERYAIPREKGRVVPNCADLEALPFIDMATRRRWQARLGQHRPVALFLGSWHGPNLEAAAFVVERLAPAHPGVAFYLAGSLCDHGDFQRPLGPNVRALGRVSERELRVLLASVDVALNPMQRGSGSNLKMLDYTASGVPVLTTPFGNRGLEFPRHAVWQAECDTQAETLGRLLATDDAHRETAVGHARAITERDYAWPSAVRHLDER